MYFAINFHDDLSFIKEQKTIIQKKNEFEYSKNVLGLTLEGKSNFELFDSTWKVKKEERKNWRPIIITAYKKWNGKLHNNRRREKWRRNGFDYNDLVHLLLKNEITLKFSSTELWGNNKTILWEEAHQKLIQICAINIQTKNYRISFFNMAARNVRTIFVIQSCFLFGGALSIMIFDFIPFY